MMYSEKQLQFGEINLRNCRHNARDVSISLHVTENVPKNRFCKTASGETGLNYLCKGYYQYFDHVAPYMDFMKKELLAQRPPANIMEAIRKGTL